MLGAEGLGVEVHAEGRVAAVLQRHHGAIGSMRCGQQFAWQLAHVQRVVAARVQWTGQAGEQALAIMEDRRRAAVHRGTAADLGAEAGADRLMTEADPENGQRA